MGVMYLGVIVLLTVLFVKPDRSEATKLTEVFAWKQVDFQFPSENVRNAMIKSKRYIQANNSMLGIGVWRSKLFITVPRWYRGTASSLNYVSLNSKSKSPLLIPYPDFASNDISTGNLDNKIISASRIFIDSCHRLWVLDNGQEEIVLTTPTVLASHKVLIYDLTTNKLIRRVLIGNDFKFQLSLFYEVVVDITNNNCNKAFAYIADTIGYGMLVYNWETNKLTRISNTFFYFEPQSSVFDNMQFNDGVIGLALSGVNPDGYKTLYFHALASYNEYNVSTRVLQDPDLSADFNNFKLIGNRGDKCQSSTQRLDEKTGVLLYAQVQMKGIGCWNSKLHRYKYSPATTALADADTRITFPSALTTDAKRNVWLLSNSLLSFFESTLNVQEFNYRVFNASVDTLIKDTVCNTK